MIDGFGWHVSLYLVGDCLDIISQGFGAALRWPTVPGSLKSHPLRMFCSAQFELQLVSRSCGGVCGC